MAWTTSRLQAVADKWGREQPGRLTPELLAHIAPVAYANINFRGTFRFPFERYRHRLFYASGPNLTVVGG